MTTNAGAGQNMPPATGEEVRRVVVGVDGSDSSKQALLWARFMARMSASPLEVVGVWLPFTAHGVMGAGLAMIPPDVDPAGEAERSLTATVDEVFGADRPIGLRLTVREGNAAQVLIAAGRNAQLLVVGSRGWGGFPGLMLGSVSTACVEHARCPVIVLHGDTPPPTDSTSPITSG